MTTTTTDDHQPPADADDGDCDARRDDATAGSPGLGLTGWRSRSRHYLALTVLVFAVLTLVGSTAVWSADEGALLSQLRTLSDDGRWSQPHPFPAADPGGTAFPLHLSSWENPGDDFGAAETCPADGVGCRYVSLAKHTLYTTVAAAAYGRGGYEAVLAISALGVIIAAITASRLAGRIEPAAEFWALWLAGLGSPLLFHALIGWAHGPAAALIGLGVLGVLSAEDGDTPRHRLYRLGGLAALGVAVMLRTEAVLAGLAVALGWTALSLLPRLGPDRLRSFTTRPAVSTVTGLAAGAVAVAAMVIDRLIDHPTAGPVEPVGFGQAFGLISGRIEGLANTWLRPSYQPELLDLLVVVAALALIAGTYVARRAGMAALGSEKSTRTLTAAAGVSTLCLVLHLFFEREVLVPGLVLASPILFVGLILMDHRVRSGELAAVTLPFVLFCGAVLATQYRGGGGAEWGGRYFAVGLPLGLAAASVGLVRTGRLLGLDDRRRIAALVVTSIAVLNLMGLVGVRASRDRTEDLGRNVLAAAVDAGDGDARPVVVTTIPALGRWMWEDLGQVRMLRVSADELESTADRLADLGVERLILVSTNSVDEADAFERWFAPDQDALDDGREIIRLDRTR